AAPAVPPPAASPANTTHDRTTHVRCGNIRPPYPHHGSGSDGSRGDGTSWWVLSESLQSLVFARVVPPFFRVFLRYHDLLPGSFLSATSSFHGSSWALLSASRVVPGPYFLLPGLFLGPTSCFQGCSWALPTASRVLPGPFLLLPGYFLVTTSSHSPTTCYMACTSPLPLCFC
ncbi:hypothetical protein OTU49_000061, partial [Cherax quadricarinatus]